jgi:hypothetical protein
MTFILVEASLILALVALAQVKSVEFSDPTQHLLCCLAYGFAPATVGYAMAIINRFAGRGQGAPILSGTATGDGIIFLVILAAGQMVQSAKL